MNVEDALMTFINHLDIWNFGTLLQSIFVMFAILWGFTVLWVWSDSSERTSSLLFRMSVTIFVLPFNIPGLIIYYLIRPPLTIEEVYWSELERRYLVYETAELNDCPKCDEALMPGFNNCPNCGYVIKVKCIGCGVMINREHKYCQFCGEQNRQRAVSKEVLTTEVMETAIEGQRADVIEFVEEKGAKYTRSNSLVERIGNTTIRFFGDLKKALLKVKTKGSTKKIKDKKNKKISNSNSNIGVKTSKSSEFKRTKTLEENQTVKNKKSSKEKSKAKKQKKKRKKKRSKKQSKK